MVNFKKLGIILSLLASGLALAAASAVYAFGVGVESATHYRQTIQSLSRNDPFERTLELTHGDKDALFALAALSSKTENKDKAIKAYCAKSETILNKLVYMYYGEPIPAIKCD